MVQSVSSPEGIKRAFEGTDVAIGYIDGRFESELNRLLHDRQVMAVNRAIGRTRPRRTLEIAPGPGRLTRGVLPTGPLVCLEYNQPMIVQGRPACPGTTLWARGDGFRLPFGQVFDLAYTFRFVRHFRRADRERLYAEIRRVLSPGGLFLMDAVNERVSRPLRDSSPESYPIHDELYRPESLRDELEGAGFEVLELQPVQVFYRWQYRSQILLGPRWDRLNRLVVRALEHLPWGDGLEWIVTCRRA